MTRLKLITKSLLGDIEQIGSERYFVTITTLIASVFLMILCMVHYAMSLKLAPIYYAGSSALVILGLYFLVRFNSCLFIPKLALSILGLVMLDFTWYSKFLSNGPVLFFLLIFGALLLWVWEGKSLAFLLALYYLNVLILFFIDYNSPEVLFQYPNLKKRSFDIFLSFTLYSSLLIFLLYTVKKDFIRQTEKAVKSDRLKSAFLANMSHEIRTPLNAIVGFSQLLNNKPGEDDRHQYVNLIQDSSNTLLRLINDIIDLSKIEAGDMDIRYSHFSIRELFIELKDTSMIELYKQNKPDIQLGFSIPEDDFMVCSDYYRLKQILSNLLNNAIKFTSKGSVTFSCTKQMRDLLFTVTDTGTGIPEDDQKKIFERFVKFNYEGMNTEGSGIGLSIVEKIVHILNGRIWVESTIGEGSKFYFTLPHQSSASISSKSDESEKLLQSAEITSNKSILVVEDERPSFQLIKETLKSLNIDIHHVTDGLDAINFIRSNPDTALILMDLKLPYLDGYEATREIKKIKPDIPVIGQTAYAMLGDKERAMSAGCDYYITKPLDLNKLQTLVKFCLSGTKSEM